MLRVDIRALRQGPVATTGQLAPDDPVWQDLALDLRDPVRVTGTLQASGREAYYWQGEIRGTVHGECRRCLSEVVSEFVVPVHAIFSSDPATADDPEVYPLPQPVTAIDLTPAVREEVGLAVPAYPVCRDDCAGLCPRCGRDLNQGPCACAQVPEAI